MLHRRYGKPSRFLSFADACKLDRKAERKAGLELQMDYYVDPIIKQADGDSDWRVAKQLARSSWRESWGAWLLGRLGGDLEQHNASDAAAAELIQHADEGRPQAARAEILDEANDERPEESKREDAPCNNTGSSSSSSSSKVNGVARGGN